MEYLLLFYNMANILLYGICACGFLLLYGRNRSRRDLWVALMFAFFLCDNVIFTMTEFIPRFMDFYRQMMALAPYLNNLITILMIYSYRMVLAHLLDDRPGANERLIHVAFFVMFFLLTAMAGAWAGRLLYLLMDYAAVAAVLARGYWALHRKREAMTQGRHRRILWLLTVSAALHAGGAVERAYVRLVLNQPASRSVCYELFGLVCVAAALWQLFRQLGRAEGRGPSDEELLRLFISQYRLTAREAELLPMLLAGEDNATISQKHFISLNTVKVHTHNIYQKLGIERRGQLAQCLAGFKKSRADSADLS